MKIELTLSTDEAEALRFWMSEDLKARLDIALRAAARLEQERLRIARICRITRRGKWWCYLPKGHEGKCHFARGMAPR